jgi:2-polyprenyl-3-methyl-5-hydroxy-6-metoxy-1,4-benzoquinol methylase
MKINITNAGDVKPDFAKVKDVWAKMLYKYYDDKGDLEKQYMEGVNCPYCNNSSNVDSFKLNGFMHVKCSECLSVYVTPRLKPEYIDKLYSDTYYSEMFTKSMIPVFEKRKKLIGESKYKQVLDFSVEKGSVLDIGAGIGEVIDVFKDNGWDCDIVELNPAAIEWLKKRGHNVNEVHFEEFEVDKKYDVVMAWGVVEHVLDPLDFLKRAYKLVKPGGVFISEVPHGNSMLVDYCRMSGKDPERILQGEQHIMLYSIDAYTQIHKKAGFKLEKIKTNGLDFSTILKINNESLSDKLIFSLQKLVDENKYGDLLRGFWRKPF